MKTGTRRNRFIQFIKEKSLVFVAVPALGAILVNLLFLNLTDLGLVSSITFFVSMGAICGKVLSEEDPLPLQLAKGFLIILTMMIINGAVLLYLNLFSKTASIIIATLWLVVFLTLYLRKRSQSRGLNQENASSSDGNGRRLLWASAAGSVIVVVAGAFYLLIKSRTLEPMSDVWATIPIRPFILLMFTSAFLVISLILLRRKNSSQLVLISIISFMVESIYYLVWYPSLYGDPLVALGISRYVEKTGSIFAHEFLFSHGQWLDLISGSGYPVAIVQFARLSNLDIYWVHNIAVPFLWAIFVPFSLYEIACLLVNKPTKNYPKEALLSAFSGALLVPILVTWGANPTSNSLGFVFLFFSVPLILHWTLRGGRLRFLLAFLVLFVTLMIHTMPGIVAFAFLLGAIIWRKSKKVYLLVICSVGLTTILPLALLNAGSSFIPEGLFSVQHLVSFENTIITIPFVLGVAGIILCAKRKTVNRQILLMLVVFFFVFAADFYAIEFGLTNVLFGAHRILVITNFLLVPFIGIFLAFPLEALDLFNASNEKLQAFGSTVGKASKRLKYGGILLIASLLALQVTVTTYVAYPQNEVTLAPTVYEEEAIYYINSTATHRYVVLSDTLFTNLAIGLLGQDYSYIGTRAQGAFGIPEWNYPLQKDFLAMVNEPSFETLDDAIQFASADEAYFVISIRNPDFDRIIQQMSEMLPVDRVFGDGKLYVFKYPVPVYEGLGPKVGVVYDGGTASEGVESKYHYSVKTDVTYSVELTGHYMYNVTGYPQYWVFNYLTVNNEPQGLDNSSDINSFIFMRGLATTDILKIRWRANDDYQLCGWKEDSFIKGWGPYPKYIYKINPMITSGSYLSLSGSFTPDIPEDYYYAKPANISTDDYPFIMIRWKSTARIALSYIYFEDGSNQEIIPFGSFSLNWKVTTVNLKSNERIVYVMVGISDIGATDLPQDGIWSLFVDYILICNRSL